MASEDLDNLPDGGPGGPKNWVDDFTDYVSKKPDASDDDLFKQFPQLMKDSKRLDAAFSYAHGRSQGMSDDDAKKMYPDLIGPTGYIDPKNRVQKEYVAPPPKSNMPTGKQVAAVTSPSITTSSGTGPTPDQTKDAFGRMRSMGDAPAAPQTSKNPASKPFADYEQTLNDYAGTSKMLNDASNGTSPQQQAMSYAPVPTSLPADQNQSVQLQKQLPLLQQQAKDLKKSLTEHEVAAGGTLKDIDDDFIKNIKDYQTADGQLDYGKIHDQALAKSQEYGGDRAVGEVIYNRATSALKFQQIKPQVDAQFKEMTGKAPADYFQGENPELSAGLNAMKSEFQTDYEAEARRSQDVINQKSSNLFATKYQPKLDQLAQQFGPQSAQVQQGLADAKAGYAEDLRQVQIGENARLVRIREELGRQAQARLEKFQGGVTQDQMDDFNRTYGQAYQNVVNKNDQLKRDMAAASPGSMISVFGKALWSGLNSWAASRGTGLIAAGFNNPITDWMRSRQTQAEASDIPDAPLSGANLLNPNTYASRAGKMVGGMLPDIAITAATKNPMFGGLEFTGSSTLSGMGDVYTQAKAEGDDDATAQRKAMDFAHANFISTLPANMLMSSAITANLKGAGGAVANILKEAGGGLGAALPQQFNTQAASKNAKSLGEFLQEDAPTAALENLVGLAAGAGIMRAVGHVTQAMKGAGAQSTQQQFISDIIDKQGPNMAHAILEYQYLNGVVDKTGLDQGKAMIDQLISTKTGLSQINVHPDLQKLYLDKKADIQNLQALHDTNPDEIAQKVLQSQIKAKQGEAEDILNGKAPYLKLTSANGSEFVVPADKAEAFLAQPNIAEDLAGGRLKVEAFGKDKDVKALNDLLHPPTEEQEADPLQTERSKILSELINHQGDLLDAGTPFDQDDKWQDISKRLHDVEQSIEDAKIKPAEQRAAQPGAEGEEAPQSNVTEVRHAITAEDEQGVTSGPTDVPLNSEGIAQAKALAHHVSRDEIDQVASSDLPRGVHTAQEVANRTGAPHTVIPELASWKIGEFDKMKDTQFKKAEKFFVNNPAATEFEGKKLQESFGAYKDRIIKARSDLERTAEGKTLLVNHGGNIAVWDAYVKNGRKWTKQTAADYLKSKPIPPAQVRGEEGQPDRPTMIPGRTAEFSHFYNNFKDEIGHVRDSSFDYRLDVDMDQKTREGAVKDIESGKNTKRGAKLLDELQKQFDAGTIEYTRGRGNHVEKFGIPIKEWETLQKEAEPEVAKRIESGEIPEHELLKWLQEEASKVLQDDTESAAGETGHASGDGETGTSEDERVHPVRPGDEAEARTSSGAAKDEPLPAADRVEGPVRKAGARDGAEPVQGKTSEDLEEAELQNDLAFRLGKKSDTGARLFVEDGASKKFDKLSNKPVEVDGKENTPEQYLSKAQVVLKQLFPDHEIRAYDTEKEYMEKEGRPAGSAGMYDPEGKYIALNMERIRKAGAENTIFHEVIHPIVNEALTSRPGAVDAAYTKLVEMKDIPGMEKVWQHEELYRDRGLSTMKVEAITEFLTHVADGSIDPRKFEPSIRTKIIDTINKVFKAIGVKRVIATAQDIGRLADRIKQAFADADATPVKQALGKTTDGAGGKMDAMKPIGQLSGNPMEDFVREKLDTYKEASIRKALVDTGGMKDVDAQALIDKIRNERTDSPEDIIRQAMALGKQKRAAASQQIASQTQAKAMEPGLLKTLRRWYFDGVDDVSDVKSIIRKNKGNEEFNIDKIYHATRKLVNFWNTIPAVKQMAFMLGVEKPELLAGQPQHVKDMAAAYRDRLDKTFQTIQSVLPNVAMVNDYFPHFWEKPDQVRNFMANTLAKAPLEGSKGFAKKRFFETIVAGLQEGYKLSTTNPEEMVRLAEANAWKFKTARDILGDMDKKGWVQMAPMGEGPAGWQTVKDPAFQNMAMRMKSFKTGDSKMAALYMPPDVAKLMNTYLSNGINGPVKNVVSQYNNIKNLFQLGVGFFHVGTTTTDALVTGMTNGIQKLSAGNPMGLIDIATFGNLPATVMRGFKAKSDWNAGKVTADTQALMDANARVGRQKMYSIDAKYNMMKAFGRLRADGGDFKEVSKLLGKTMWNAMLWLPEAINKPLMEHWVPALKVGGYLRSLDSEIASRKNMTPEELQTAKQKIWDQMDDRLGQVVYDNIFVNKAAKDMAFMAIRSAGWTGGTIRALSGGIAEIPRSGQRLLKGQGLSQRTAYLAALPLTVGMMGAFYQYALTGQPPQEMKDYFYPKDGTKNPDGTDHRVDFPSYVKDILSYYGDVKSVFAKGQEAHPFKTIGNKTSPILNDIKEIFANKDFYGEKIYNKDDPFYQKGLDVLKHEAQSMEPFSFKKNPYDESPFSDQFTTRAGIEQKFGIMPAPKERDRSDLQNAISQAYQDQMGKEQEGKTHAEMVQQIARRHLREFLFNGGDYKDASQEWKDDAAITSQALGKFIHDSKMDPYERYFRQLKPDTKIRLYQDMSDEDKAKYEKDISVALRAKANAPKPDNE